MEAGLRLRALSHRYYHYYSSCGGFRRGGLAAARGVQRRRVGTCSSSPAFCSLAASGNGNGAAVGPVVGSGAEVARAKRMLHVVLVSPLIPGNTGSIARTCAASAVGLHLVGPLGFNVDDTKLKRAGLDYWPYPFIGCFNVDDTKLKRAGLDYWPHVVVKIHDSWDDFRDYFMKQEGEKRLLAFTKRGTSIHSGISETKGLPQQALEDCSREGLGGGTIRIPMVETYARCLNLSVSVGIALYEAARQLNYEQLQYQPELPEEAQGLFPAEDIYA